MIIIYHKDNRVCSIFDFDNQKQLALTATSISKVLLQIAEQYPNRLLVWCHVFCQRELNVTILSELFHHKKILLSYNSKDNYFPPSIGYIEETPFINVNKKVSYPTWQMSSIVGGIHAEMLIYLRNEIVLENNFDYFLCSVAKLGMPKGLFCYSEPKLLKNEPIVTNFQVASVFELFRFVKQHYNYVWVVLLFFDILIYEKKINFFPFLFSWFYKKRKSMVKLDHIQIQSSLKVSERNDIDVVIPTIGRKKYLYDILCDLQAQTHLPKNVIIIEQNTSPDSTTELDFVLEEIWAFNIKHTFTHQLGACNARNIGLQQVESEWVFLADDDIRIKSNFIKQALKKSNKFGIKAAVFSCLLAGKKNDYTTISQTTMFGSGCSIVRKSDLENVKFNESLEFGYGEDTDFGLQLRNIGIDIIYFPKPNILHLKAPIGGFRTKPILEWSVEVIQPKPSPTVILIKQLFDTREQISGYKMVFFLKLLKENGLKNSLLFLNLYKKQWKSSLYWAKQLKKIN